MIQDEFLQEDDERIGMETDAWMDVPERKEFIPMDQSPGTIAVFFKGKPTLSRSKFGGKAQFWFPVEQVMDLQTGVRMERILSTSSNKLRSGIKQVFAKHPDLFDGKKLVAISWAGNGMDRSYSVGQVVIPWNE